MKTCLKLALVALLLVATQTASTQTYSFPYNDSIPIDFTTNSYYRPVYDLGVLDAGQQLSIVITIPNFGASPALDILTIAGAAAGTFAFYYQEYTTTGLVTKTLFQAGGIAPLAYTASGMVATYTFTAIITFESTATFKSAPVKLALSAVGLALAAIGQIDYVGVEVTYTSPQGSSVSNPTPVQTLLKVTEILRDNVVKVFYVGPSSPAFKFSNFPTTMTGGVLATEFAPILYFLAGVSEGLTGNEWAATEVTADADGNVLAGLGTSIQENAYAIAAVPSDNILVGGVAHYSVKLPTGFYALEMTYAGTQNDFIGRITFQTDAYACPFNPDFGDYYSNFQGCTQSTVTNGAPCASFDTITQTCVLCIPGYTLVNGSCWANTTCPARQYFHFGQCLDVSVDCGTFDPFTGACLTCADPANFDLVNGSCTHKAVTCAANQWQTNYTCYNASTTCATFNPNTGACLTCVSELYQLNADGTCTLIVVVCPQGQYAVGLKCLTIPVECLQFDTTLQKCLSCIPGYFVQNGTCQRIVCPAGQVPSKYSIFCVSVSSLCKNYDSLTGDCLSCKDSNHAVRNGQCAQVTSPLAGCKEREALGFGPCVGADVNCFAFNLVTGNCDTCNTGYYIDQTGRCALSANCGVGQWSVNGGCIGIPDNCLFVDNLGLCTQCVSSDYRLQQGQCVYFKTCKGQQYLNNGGQCIDVSPNCATWNPSNGQCVTCKTVGTQPTQGVCCPTGQVYSSNKCVDATALQNSYQSATGPACLIKHPSINICLKCANGYAPDYTVSFACARSQ